MDDETDVQRSGSGNGERRRASHRRKTVSGPVGRREDEDVANIRRTEAMRFPWSSPSAPSSPTAPASPTIIKPSGHKRSLSGSILARLNFLRNSNEDGRPPSREKEPTSPRSAKSRKSIDDDPPVTSPTSPKSESAMAFALMPTKMRKRKGSLRKTALLGGRRIMSEGRERRNSLLQRSASNRASLQQDLDADEDEPQLPTSKTEGSLSFLAVPTDPIDLPINVRRQFSYESPVAQSSSESGWSESATAAATRLSLVTEHKSQPSTTNSSTGELGSPLDIKSPISQTSYASTTDDDDALTFDRPAATNANVTTLPPAIAPGLALAKPHSSAATSYFPSASLSTSSTHSLQQTQCSPLSHTISAASASSHAPPTGLLLLHQPHSYTETEYWGWIILFVTWLTFTVGMGSCLELWSWAWDVGETPYAPPELEDDPTLPIVGYYPALIVLTGVVAWVWITVAWVGMKYFRHAKIEV